jgi:hypothetical protein
MPSTPFMGVRISWLMTARNSLRSRAVFSAARRALSASSRSRALVRKASSAVAMSPSSLEGCALGVGTSRSPSAILRMVRAMTTTGLDSESPRRQAISMARQMATKPKNRAVSALLRALASATEVGMAT